ncbi:MAG TPA: WecB/TagA/CpsF family glycosyltransferase, partial [Opitutaceae bacterium]|nr:WecB/TagA/CpsF family glycosyltransferase [Opitutaceae bacterium]
MNTASVSLSTDARDFSLDSPAASAGTAPARWPVSLLGVPFDNVTIAEALARIDAMIAARIPRYVVTANVDFLVQAQHDVELRRILLEAELVLCDGTPLLWASRWLGNPLPERVAGSDLAPSLLANAARRGHRVFLLGAGPGIAAEAAARLQRQYPALNLVGHYAPPFAALLEMDHAEIARRVCAAQPDILLVSFGCPKQEKWIAMHFRSLGVPVSIGVGATIDFLAGRVRRAPGWMRRSGTEWLFRLALEPRRLFRRYARDIFVFLPTFATQWSRLARRAPSRSPHRNAARPSPAPSCFALEREFTRRALEQDRRWASELDAPSAACVLDGSAVEHIDAT